MVIKLIKIPTESTPNDVNIIPCFKTVEEGILPEGTGLSFVRSIMASISRSMNIFRSVEPDIARNRPTFNHKKVLTTIPVVVQALIR